MWYVVCDLNKLWNLKKVEVLKKNSIYRVSANHILNVLLESSLAVKNDKDSIYTDYFRFVSSGSFAFYD